MSKPTKPDLSLYQGINPSKLPRVWYPFYVVYKYRWWKTTYIIGFDTDVQAAKFQEEILTKTDIERCELLGHFPRELLED